ncbi:MAG: hypothetical protein IJP97_03110 [Synergistaceae bacterium]|nr:hypothetical protein [Synergistaceae bacterium]MBQ9628083.1 hypothetical protein [Synergistaceae bacterium]MBR0069465.1 hypothetical protein [Synergistaceae bacterium]
MSMTDSENSKCHAIIHSAAVAAGAVGAGLAQIPLSDNAIIMPIQIGMVASLGNVFGKSLGETTIKSLISAAAGTVIGRSASQALLGWVPVLGNVINASTAFTITEAIGWAIANKFADDVEQERKKIAEEEAHRQREAEIANIETEAVTSVTSPLRNAISQIFFTVKKFFLSVVNFFCRLPGRLWRMTMYVLGGIWRFVRTCLFLLWGLISGRAVQVLKWIALKIWSGICALFSTLINGLMYSIGVGIGIFALSLIADKMNLLSPEYQVLLHDFLQAVKEFL